MFASKSTGGFYDITIHTTMPEDVVEITTEQYKELLSGQSDGKLITYGDDGFPLLSDRPPIPLQIPQKVTMRQARRALYAAGLLTGVEAAIDALPEPPRTAARIEWDYASEVHRASEFVTLLGAALELDKQSLEDLFLKASEL